MSARKAWARKQDTTLGQEWIKPTINTVYDPYRIFTFANALNPYRKQNMVRKKTFYFKIILGISIFSARHVDVICP